MSVLLGIIRPLIARRDAPVVVDRGKEFQVVTDVQVVRNDDGEVVVDEHGDTLVVDSTTGKPIPKNGGGKGEAWWKLV